MNVECLLLTWHGTVVCADPEHGLVSEPLTNPVLPDSACRMSIATDGELPDHRLVPFTENALRYESPSLGSGLARVAGSGRGYHFSRDNRFLCASGEESWVDWNRLHAQTWETFLPVPVEVLRNIVALRSTDWISLADHRKVPAGRVVLQRDFYLAIGDLVLSLVTAYPRFFHSAAVGEAPKKDAMFIVTHENATHAFASANSIDALESGLWLRNAEHDPSEDPHDERLPPEIRAAETLYRPPLFANRSDRLYFTERAVHGKPRAGYSTSAVRIRRAHDVHMLLGRSVEGTLFNERGVIRHYGFLTVSQRLPAGLSKMADRFYIDRELVSSAPYLRGDYFVFFTGNLQNYFHWLIEAVICLYLIHKTQGALAAKIVLPGALREAARLPYFESLDLFGLGGIEQVIRPEPVVKLERAYWIDAAGDLLESFPEHEIVELQARIAHSLGVTQATKRVYVEREAIRKVANAVEVRRFFEQRGFVTVRLDGMPIVEQARVFASAEFVAGPHGAGLSNLIFTPPHARVIEFIPNMEMRSFFWLISSKLGHEYAMLPCPTDGGGGFNDDMLVDMTKLERLFTFLEHA
jgi:capsular polysaccharide biosynthesis protein